MKDRTSLDRTRILVEVALTIALAAVLGMIRLWKMPQGGTISLAMLPIFVLALRRGPFVGVAAGALYGVLDLFVDPFPPVHWIQPLLDYPVAYAMCGLAGLFAWQWRTHVHDGPASRAVYLAAIPAVVLGSSLRYGVHVISGVVFFAEYAPVGQPVLVYSLVYNTFVLASALLCAVAVAVVMPALERWRAAGVAE